MESFRNLWCLLMFYIGVNMHMCTFGFCICKYTFTIITLFLLLLLLKHSFLFFCRTPWADCVRFHSQWKQSHRLRGMACELSQSCHLQSGILLLLLLLWRTSVVYGNYWHWSPEDIALLLGRHFSTLAETRCSQETWLTTHTAGWRTLWPSPITMESLAARLKSCALSWNCEGLKDYTKSRNLMGTLMDFAADWKHRP